MSIRGIYKILFERSIFRAYLLYLTRILDNNNIHAITVTRGAVKFMLTLTKVVAGIGSAGSNCYKDILQGSQAMYDGSSHDCEVCCCKGTNLALNMNRAKLEYMSEIISNKK